MGRLKVQHLFESKRYDIYGKVKGKTSMGKLKVKNLLES